VAHFQVVVREQHGWRASLNMAEVYLVIGWTVVKVTMAAASGLPKAYVELMSGIDNLLWIRRSVEGVLVFDSWVAAQAPWPRYSEAKI
jgi:hypothetical protein